MQADQTQVWAPPPPPVASSNGHRKPAGGSALAHPQGDWALVRELANLVGDRLTEVITTREQLGKQLTEVDKRELGRTLIERELQTLIRSRAESGQATPLAAEEDWLRQAVFAVQFGMGRLEALVADPDIENIIINGHDRVQLWYADGRKVPGPPVADSEEELRELINRIGTRLGSAERSLTPSNVRFRMSLPDGSRMSAVAYVTPRTQVAIRRHPIADASLADMVDMGMISRSMHAFLGALMRRRMSTLVVGPQEGGKTSLMRSMLHELPPSVRFATIESEYELNLHADAQRHPWVLPLEARPGSAEKFGAADITLSDLVQCALGQATSLLAVGEVLGDEIIPMFNAMMAGGSGVATLHAETARDAFSRMAVLCGQANGMPAPTAYRLAAAAVKYVVVVNMVDERGVGGRVHRFVREIVRIGAVGENGLPDFEYVYAAGEDGRGLPQQKSATDVMTLRRVGFDPNWLDPANGGWERPLELMVAE